MTNIKLFLFLFGAAQTIFVVLDFYELWRRDGRPSLINRVRTEYRTLLTLAVVWLVYFSLQLGLSAAVPSIERILAAARHVLGDSPARSIGIAHRTETAVAIGIVTFFVAGFWDYLAHRFLLHSQAGWYLHESHHLPTQVFNGMPGISARPFAFVSVFLVNALSVATMFSLFSLARHPELGNVFIDTLPAIIFTFAFVGSASHSCFLRRYAACNTWPRYLFITTPREHVLHHAADAQGNYGNFTSLWDHVFGTYLDPSEFREPRLGLNYDQDFLGAITASRWKIPSRVRQDLDLGRFCYHEKSCDTERDGVASGATVNTDSIVWLVRQRNRIDGGNRLK